MTIKNEVEILMNRERERIVGAYRCELEILQRRVAQAIERLDRPRQSPISDHDAANMGSNLHELSVLAGKFAHVEAFGRTIADMEDK